MKFRTAERVAWLNRCETELDNIRAALHWSSGSEQPESGLRLAAALHYFWFVRGHQAEGIEILQRLLAHPRAAPAALPQARALRAAREAGRQLTPADAVALAFDPGT